jgi:hypothetical protein
MILHIGDNKYILQEEIIIILDRKSADGSKKTREFINKLIEDNCLIGELNSYTKSYIFVNINNKTMIYTSKISSKTLLNRGSYKELFRMEAIKWSK